MKQQIQQAPNAFEKALSDRIQATRYAINFLSLFVIALLKTKTSNLTQVAVGFASEAKAESSYKRIQRFLQSSDWKGAGIELLMLEMLGMTGKVKLIIDRTEWKFGKSWVNILTVSVVGHGVAVPLCWKVFKQKGNASAQEHQQIVQRAIEKIGKQRVQYILADREFGNAELFSWLKAEQLDFRIRLKKSHLAGGQSFERTGRKQPVKTRTKSKRAVSVFGVQVFVASVKLSATEYLVVASNQASADAIVDYKERWEIETMFGCLKSRGFEFEETHLSKPERIETLLLLLGLGLCFALKSGEIETRRKPLRKKKHGRWTKSVFRVGLDALRKFLLNVPSGRRESQFNLLANLLSCT